MLQLFIAILSLTVALSPPLDGILEPPKFLNQEDADWCADNDAKCASWAQSGECNSNPAWMMTNCKRSCQSCQGGESAWKLRDQLAANYDNSTKVLRKFITGNISVHSMFIDRIKIDEQEQNVKMNGKLVLTWNDTRIRWNPVEWQLSWLTFYWSQIWTPQIFQSNAPIGALSSTFNVLLAANYTGQVFMWLNFAFTVDVDFKYSDFPYDRQRFCLNLDNKRYYAVRFVVSDLARREADESAKKSEPPGWFVSGVDVEQRRGSVKILRQWNRDPFELEKSTVDLCVRLRRDSSYTAVELAAPSLVPALVTLASFLLDDHRRQIYVLLASLALQTLAVYPVHSVLPPAGGDTPRLLKFCAFDTTMTCLALVCVLVLYGLSTARQSFVPPPRFVSRFVAALDRLSPFCCLSGLDPRLPGPGPGSVDEPFSDSLAVHGASNGDLPVSNGLHTAEKPSPAHPAPSDHKYQWQPVAKALKCLLFLIYLILYTILLFACFVF